jgi:DNA-binding NtrC family response regulator
MMAAATLEVFAPARTLIRLHRHSLFHLLLQGGTSQERERLARAFHHGSPLRSGPFIRIEAVRDEERMRCALEHALSAVSCERPDNPLRESEGGTLFLDDVAFLTPATQHILLRFLRGHPGAGLVAGPCFGRLAVGNAEPLDAAAAAGRFDAALFDILDKIRVELRSGAHTEAP